MTKPGSAIECVRPLLAAAGFRKRTGEVFTTEVAPDVLGWLGLNTVTRHLPTGQMEVNPIVGVRHQRIEQLVAELCGEKPHAYNPPTLSVSVGYLLPERRYRCWHLGGSDTMAVAEDMVRTIVVHAVPFMQEMADRGELVHGLKGKFGIEGLRNYRIPVARLLGGDPAGAVEHLDHSLAKQGVRTDPAALRFRAFAEALRERCTRER